MGEVERYRRLLRFFSTYEPEEENTFLQELADFLSDLLKAERASVFLLSADMDTLTAEAALGVDSRGIRIDKMAGLAGYVFRTGESLLVDDAYSDERFLPDVDKETGFRTRSVVCVAIKRRDGTPIGVIEVLNRRDGVFGKGDVELLESAAAQTARVVLSMRRYRYLKEATRSLREEKTRLLRRLKRGRGVDAIVGVSPHIQNIRRLILQVAPTDSTVLVTGESGTGKELVAKALHYESPRAGSGEFVAVNCAAIPETLLEAELFGVERGAATGVEERAGKFERAHRGTLFLDEIGDMAPPMQAKLLRVLQDKRIVRLGATAERSVDVRVVAATNRNLQQLVRDGHFREDLFWRLSVIEIHIEPLRSHREDIPPLAEAFLKEACERFGKRIRGFAEGVMDALCGYHWPGNVRQLRNEVERAVLLCSAPVLRLDNFSAALRGEAQEDVGLDLRAAKERLERRLITEALRRTGGNRTAAAKLLGITREALRKKLLKFNLTRSNNDVEGLPDTARTD